jgi:hypothetical protein
LGNGKPSVQVQWTYTLWNLWNIKQTCNTKCVEGNSDFRVACWCVSYTLHTLRGSTFCAKVQPSYNVRLLIWRCCITCWCCVAYPISERNIALSRTYSPVSVGRDLAGQCSCNAEDFYSIRGEWNIGRIVWYSDCGFATDTVTCPDVYFGLLLNRDRPLFWHRVPPSVKKEVVNNWILCSSFI